MDRRIFEERVRLALRLELPMRPERRALERSLPPTRPAAVLVLFAGDFEDPSILLTRRTDSVESHKGQIALPGGMSDPGDPSDEATALRETHEEVGIAPSQVQLLGRLPQLPTFTGFEITPVVGAYSGNDSGQVPRAQDIPITPSPDEIAETFWVPLSELLLPGSYQEEQFEVGQWRYPIHVFYVGGHRVWGATGAILKNFLDRWQAVK